MSTTSATAIGSATAALTVPVGVSVALAFAALVNGTAFAGFGSWPLAGTTQGSVSLTATPDDGTR